MSGHRLSGHITEQHELVVRVPDSIPPGPVQILIVPEPTVDESEDSWNAGIAHEWVAELSDEREDIYSIEDGESLDAI